MHDGDAVVVPAGTYHNVVNASKTAPLKLYTIYPLSAEPPGWDGAQDQGRGRSCRTGGTSLIVRRRHGAGKPVVLIHGYPLSGASWEKQVPVLSAAGHRVITYDRRGFGQVWPANVRLQLRHLRRGPAQARDATGTARLLAGRFLDGRRRSGALLRETWIEGREECGIHLRRSALPTEDARQSGGVWTAVSSRGSRRPSSQIVTRSSASFSGISTTQIFCWGKRVSEQAVQASWKVAAGASATACLACVPTWHEDFRKDLTHVDVPTLVIQGDADRILPISASGLRTAKLIQGARLLVVKDGPHCITWTHADEVNRESW